MEAIQDEKMDPPYLLTGRVISDKWIIEEMLPKKEGDTGGFFSVGYKCRSIDGTKAFFKAIDLYKLFEKTDDFIRELNITTQEIQCERDLLTECKKMDKVVTSIEYGDITNDAEGSRLIYPIPFIVFELANSTARRELFSGEPQKISWSLKVLHQAAVGIFQMHGKMISHQDIKLSNILVFDKKIAKISDLGRSVQQGRSVPHGDIRWPGDNSYIPPEIAYGYLDPEFNVRRIAADMYLLGSNAACIFTKANLNAMLYDELPRQFWPSIFQGEYTGSFSEALPHLIDAFERVLNRITKSIPTDAPYKDEIINIIREWSWPDPHGRGHPITRSIIGKNGNVYSLERYLGKLDQLARTAEYFERRTQK